MKGLESSLKMCKLDSKYLEMNFRNQYLGVSVVTYWPRLSRQKKKCTGVNNRCIRSKMSGDTLDCRRMSNYYKTPATGSSDQLERRCWNENHVPAEAGPPGPRFSSPWERERNAVVSRRVRGSICCSSVPSPIYFSQIIPFVTLSNPFK